MKGTKYLSEAVDISTLSIDHLNIIEAPTGCGKTYFALEAFPKLVADASHKVLYLIDTYNGKEQIISYYKNAEAFYSTWIDEVSNNVMWIDWETHNNNVVVITYAKFGTIIDQHPHFYDYFDYIICDELPSLLKYQYYEARPNCHSVAKTALESAVENDHTRVIALTATPKTLKAFNVSPHLLRVDLENIITYETPAPTYFARIDDVIKNLDPSKVGLCYTTRIQPMLRFKKMAEDRGLKPICVWSIRNNETKMDDEQLRVREEILHNFRIPPEYNFLIINASCETSLKIKAPAVDYVIVHNTNEDTQVQVRGRVSNDISAFYLASKDFKNADLLDVIVPDEYLGVKLFTPQKNALCGLINIRNPNNNRQLGWTSLKEILCSTGYNVAEGRDGNLRYVIITLQE